MRVHLTNEKVRRVFIDGLQLWRAFGERRHIERSVRLRYFLHHRRVAIGRLHHAADRATPRAQPHHVTHQRLLQSGFLLRAHQRKRCAHGDRNVTVPGQLQHAQRVLRLLIAPGVAGHHGDAEHLDLRRLQQRQHGHLV